ncbi:MAG: DUF1205 domain-containing protein [Catenulispora sp.]|nr:DUF1205 domain-containing protein [Catenulispora sp.]
MAPVGWALRAAGHEVRYVGPRNPAEVESFLETGLDTMWFGEDLDIARHRKLGQVGGEDPMDSEFMLSETRSEVMTDDYVRSVYEMWSGVYQWAAPEPLLEELLRFARSWRPGLVVWDPMIYAGPLIAEAVGAAHARMLYAADQSARIYYQHAEMLARPGYRGPGDDPLQDWMTDWLRRHGADWNERARHGMVTIDPSPACIRHDLPTETIPVRFAPVNRPMAVQPWVVEQPDRPRICLTLGVSNRQVYGHEETSVAALLDGLSELDVEVVATLNAGQLASVPNVPDNVRAVDFVPMNELLATCSAIVHQGGGATIGNAVVNGVPQLIVPGTTWSERASALALEQRGNGLTLDLADVTPAGVRDRVARMIAEPSFARAAAEVRDEMAATPTINDIVPRLEALTSCL